MSERPPQEKALFDRVIPMLGATETEFPATVEAVAALSDLDAALSLCVVFAHDIDAMIHGARTAHRCGHCIRAGVEKWEDAKTYTDDEVTAHVAQCPHNPLVRAVWTALNAIESMSAAKLLGHVPEEFHVAHNVAIEALMRMVGR